MDLAAVIEAAVTEKLERIEAKRYGETKNPTVENTYTSPADAARMRKCQPYDMNVTQKRGAK